MKITYLPPTQTDCDDCCPKCGDYTVFHRLVGGQVECPDLRDRWRQAPFGRGVLTQQGKKGGR